jgi:hypothetical protein
MGIVEPFTFTRSIAPLRADRARRNASIFKRRPFRIVVVAVCVIGAIALVASATAANAEAPVPPKPAPHGVPVSALAGLDAGNVRTRLADVPADWPIPRAFQVASPEGMLTFVTAHDLMLGPVEMQNMTVFRTHGDEVTSAASLSCNEFMTHADGTPKAAPLVVLMFRNGLFDTAFDQVFAAPEPAPSFSDPKARKAYLRRPQTSPFIGRPGDLPLEDGIAFMSRWTKAPLLSTDELSAICAPPPSPLHPDSRAAHHSLDASDMQGLALLPFALTLPAKNRQRVAAREQGGALLQSLRVGEALGADPRGFAAHHRGVRAYLAQTSDYAVLSIDLGGYPGRNLSNFNDVALVGVRNGRVEWISPPRAFGPRGDLLCLDEHGVPSSPRPGCSSWGHFSP